MGDGVKRRFAALFHVGEAQTAAGRALLEERFKALQRQIPLLYLVVLGNVLGLHLASYGEINPFEETAGAVVLLVIVRLVHWLRHRTKRLSPEHILKELGKTRFFSALFSLAFLYWALQLYTVGSAEQQSFVILFASLAAIGCAYGLSSFPAAARLPLLLLALPLSLWLCLSTRPAHVGVGISLTLISVLTLRLLNLHNRGFTQLVQSRSLIVAERERAQAAEQVAIEEKAKVRKVADTDPLTGLANRRAFLAALEAQASPSFEGSANFVLALIDLDGFKPINDMFGHATGDAVLMEVGGRISEAAGPEAVVARMGGDEFALLAPCKGKAAVLQLGERVCAALREPYKVAGRELRLSGCCGLTIEKSGGGSVSVALSRGDMALYDAKQKGRGGASLFSQPMEEFGRRRAAIERELRDARVQDQIALVFQPIFDISTMQLISFEALARWNHPELGWVSPAEFIPISEQINVVDEIGTRLLARAAVEAAAWPDAVRLSYNMSAVELCSATSAETILATVAEHGLDPSRLQVEVTETALLVDFEAGRHNLQTLRAAGVRIVLDDFGAGFASISYLREMRFDVIKLDGSLLAEAARSQGAQRLLKGVLDLCASLGSPCVAEHIETDEQLELLRRLDCRYGQGYLLSRPLEAASAELLARSKVLTLNPMSGSVAA